MQALKSWLHPFKCNFFIPNGLNQAQTELYQQNFYEILIQALSTTTHFLLDMNDNAGSNGTDEVMFANLEYWKNIGQKDLTTTEDKSKKSTLQTKEDSELANYNYKYLPHVFEESRLDYLDHPETQKELEIVKSQNEYYIRQMREHERDYCTFFMKTGACRYGPTCKRGHVIPMASETILVEQMFRDPLSRVKGMAKGLDDSLLEFDEEELQKKYSEFYDDVFPEWGKYGKVVFFKCCNNIAPHLRGNIFIQYENMEDAIAATVRMQGRFYDGAALKITFSLIKDWKQAICAYNVGSCPKYSECNFLHVYKNPRDEFPLPDRDQTGYKKRGFQRDNRNEVAAPVRKYQSDERPDQRPDQRPDERPDQRHDQRPDQRHSQRHDQRRRRNDSSRSRSNSSDYRRKKHRNRKSRSRSRSRRDRDRKSKKDRYHSKHKSEHSHKKRSRHSSRSSSRSPSERSKNAEQETKP